MRLFFYAALFWPAFVPAAPGRPSALFRAIAGPAVMRVRYARSVTVSGATFYRVTSRVRHLRNPTDYPVRFPFPLLAFTDSAVLTYTRDAAAFPLVTHRGRRLPGGVQTLFRFDADSCREYVSDDRVNIFYVCRRQKRYAPEYDDTLYIYQFQSLSWMSGQWVPHSCSVSRKVGVVSFTLSLQPNNPKIAEPAYPGYDSNNDLTFQLAQPAKRAVPHLKL